MKGKTFFWNLPLTSLFSPIARSNEVVCLVFIVLLRFLLLYDLR
jgi:hypothetical protein